MASDENCLSVVSLSHSLTLADIADIILMLCRWRSTPDIERDNGLFRWNEYGAQRTPKAYHRNHSHAQLVWNDGELAVCVRARQSMDARVSIYIDMFLGYDIAFCSGSMHGIESRVGPSIAAHCTLCPAKFGSVIKQWIQRVNEPGFTHTALFNTPDHRPKLIGASSNLLHSTLRVTNITRCCASTRLMWLLQLGTVDVCVCCVTECRCCQCSCVVSVPADIVTARISTPYSLGLMGTKASRWWNGSVYGRSTASWTIHSEQFFLSSDAPH